MNTPMSPNIQAYSQLRNDASAAMLGLDQQLWKKGFDMRETPRRRARRDQQRDQKYAGFGHALGGLGQLYALSQMMPSKPPASPGGGGGFGQDALLMAPWAAPFGGV